MLSVNLLKIWVLCYTPCGLSADCRSCPRWTQLELVWVSRVERCEELYCILPDPWAGSRTGWSLGRAVP